MKPGPEPIPPPGTCIVLMYHGLQAGRHSPGRFDPRYSVHPDTFRRQLDYLRERRLAAWLPVAGEACIAPPPDGPQPMVLITFDDGDASTVDIALPILRESGHGALFFITRDFVGQRGMITGCGVRQLAAAGMGIGSHGVSHQFLNTLSPAALEFELADSRAWLGQLAGREVVLLSLPGGRGGEREILAAREAGYRGVFGSEPGNNRDRPPNGLIQRIAVTRDLSLRQFRQLVTWSGRAAWRVRARHRILRWPKRVVGDRGYDWLRRAWVR